MATPSRNSSGLHTSTMCTDPKPGASPTQPDAAPLLHAPWRLQYLEKLDEKEKVTGPPSAGSGSFLLDAWRDPASDIKNHVIIRTATGLILLNAFPYANGHLLVALGEPRSRLLDYDPAQRADLWRHVDLAMDLLQRTLQPQGVNLGLNQGRAAGAGVPQHLHVHLVPRWGGDTNFISIVGQVRVIPSSLEVMGERFRAMAKVMGCV